MPDVFVASDSDNKDAELPKQESTFKHPENILGLKDKHTKNPLVAFAVHPLGLKFETQADEEEIVLLLRQHIVTTVPSIVVVALLIFIPFWLPIGFSALGVDVSAVPTGFKFVGILIWYLLTFGFAIERFVNWYFNIYIVTNERAIDVDFFSLLYKQVSDAPISKIQDVTYSMGGLVRAMFDYGDVRVQTAGEMPNFEFLAVPKPDVVAKVISDLMQKEEKEAEGNA